MRVSELAKEMGYKKIQNKLVDAVDKLNFVTTNELDGKFMSKTGGMVKVFLLSASTELTQLKIDYTGNTKHIEWIPYLSRCPRFRTGKDKTIA